MAAALAAPEIRARVDRVLAVPLGLATLAYAIVNGVAAVRYWRRRNYGWVALWAALAIVQMLAGLALWSAAL